jgi:hypothetical protein
MDKYNNLQRLQPKCFIDKPFRIETLKWQFFYLSYYLSMGRLAQMETQMGHIHKKCCNSLVLTKKSRDLWTPKT